MTARGARLVISPASVVNQQCGFFLLPLRGCERSDAPVVADGADTATVAATADAAVPASAVGASAAVAAVTVPTIAPAEAAAASSGAAVTAPRRCLRAFAGGSLISPAVTGWLFARRGQLEV